MPGAGGVSGGYKHPAGRRKNQQHRRTVPWYQATECRQAGQQRHVVGVAGGHPLLTTGVKAHECQADCRSGPTGQNETGVVTGRRGWALLREPVKRGLCWVAKWPSWGVSDVSKVMALPFKCYNLYRCMYTHARPLAHTHTHVHTHTEAGAQSPPTTAPRGPPAAAPASKILPIKSALKKNT